MSVKVKGFEVYTLYVAMKAHFKTKSYDFVKFGGKIRSRVSTYENRKDKYYFEKLAKKYSENEIKEILLSNIVENEDLWIGDAFDTDAEDTWKKWRSKKDSLERVFNSEFNSICEFVEENNMKFDEFFQSNNGDHPEVLKWYLRKDVSVETFLILDSLMSFVLRLNSDLKDDVVWKEHSQKIIKYRSFFSTDTKRFRKKALDILKKYEIQK
jgi:hypothetical protein